MYPGFLAIDMSSGGCVVKDTIAEPVVVICVHKLD